MALNQLAAITGRRYTQRPVRPSSSYILNVFAEKAAQEQREREFAAEEDWRTKQLDLEREAFKHGKTQAQVGTGIAAAGLGTQMALLYPQYKRYQESPPGPAGTGQPNALSEEPWYGRAFGGPALGGGVTGGLVGQVGKKPWHKAAIGAGVGAGLSYWGSGGDYYSTAGGGILGLGAALALDQLFG